MILIATANNDIQETILLFYDKLIFIFFPIFHSIQRAKATRDRVLQSVIFVREKESKSTYYEAM